MKRIRIASLQTAATPPSDGKSLTDHNLSWTIEQIKKLAGYGVQLVCLPEAFIFGGLDAFPEDHAELIEGKTLTAIRAIASQLEIAVLCPIIEKEDKHCFNTAFFIGDGGSIIGKYRKIHPTEFELKDGIMPGDDMPTIIEWKGMKIGVQICFDANWPQDWINLKRAGAEIIFFCSAFSAGKLLESYATLLRIPVVAATWCPHCRIYDRCGRIMAHQSPYYPYAIADMLIKQPLFHLDFQTDKVETIRRQHSDISVDIHNGEGTWTIAGNDLGSIINEHQLIDVDDYFVRAEIAQKRSTDLA